MSEETDFCTCELVGLVEDTGDEIICSECQKPVLFEA